MEIWKDIKGYEGKYQISNYGRVKAFNCQNRGYEKILSLQTKPDGYLCVQLYNKNKPFTITIHRLVAIHFIENPEFKPEVNHIDCIKTNNHIDNLEWVTRSENIQHGYDNGLIGSGINHVRSKLSKQDVIDIFYDKSNQRDIVKKYKLSSHSIVGCIKRKESYLDIVKDL